MVALVVVMVPAATFGTSAAQQGGNFMVTVAGTAVGSIPHQIDLKVTQLPGGQLSEVTGFIVGPEDVVQVKQGENLIVSTSPDLTTHQVTVRNIQGIPIDLVPLPSNAWSLQGLLPGVYTLNVNVAMSSSGFLGTYETILVILEPDQQPLPPTTAINQITIRQPPPPGGCPPNYMSVNGTCVEPPSPPPLPPSPTPNPTPTDYCYLPGIGDWWDNPDCREYLENKYSRKPVCTPDGPPCPPCPEGVEAGWCADEDERQDTDDDLGNDEEGGGDEPEGGNGEGNGEVDDDIPSSIFGNGNEHEDDPEPVID